MSISSRLRIIAVGAALVAPMAPAQTEHTELPKSPAITQTITNDFPWANGSADTREIYASLPAEYKAFANKSFMERVEMREEWEQRDFIRRDKARKAHPDENSQYPTAEGDYSMKILKDRLDGRLTPAQAMLAHDMITFGRPLTSIDLSKPYGDQLRECGFTTMADVVDGKKEHDLSPRDHALFIWQIQEAEQLNRVGKNPEAWRETKIRMTKEDQEHYEANTHWYDALFRTKTRYLTELEMDQHKAQWENINGKKVLVPVPNQISYSVRDEITRKVGQKIAQEEKLLTRQAINRQISR